MQIEQIADNVKRLREFHAAHTISEKCFDSQMVEISDAVITKAAPIAALKEKA